MHNNLLSGVRILDLTNVLAGPYASYQLALLGADVVKIEIPGEGDLARQLGSAKELNDAHLGSSFLGQNANKRSLELDLKSDEGQQRFDQLVTVADVVIENFRAGVFDRLGYTSERLQALNPQLVYCSISGFGQSGPLSQAPAYDQVIQGLSGMMSVTGTPETAPLRVGFPVCDILGGLTAAFTISAALVRRDATGRGARLDVSMLEAAMSAMGWTLTNYLVSGVEPHPMGDQNATAAPSGTFRTADGLLNIAANRQSQFESLCRLTGCDELLVDPRFATRDNRKKYRVELNREVDSALSTRDAAHWEAELNAVGVPAARIVTVAEAVRSDQLAHRRFFTDLEFPGWDDRVLTVAGSATHVDGEPTAPTDRPPLLGEHNSSFDAIVHSWGEQNGDRGRRTQDERRAAS